MPCCAIKRYSQAPPVGGGCLWPSLGNSEQADIDRPPYKLKLEAKAPLWKGQQYPIRPYPVLSTPYEKNQAP